MLTIKKKNHVKCHIQNLYLVRAVITPYNAVRRPTLSRFEIFYTHLRVYPRFGSVRLFAAKYSIMSRDQANGMHKVYPMYLIFIG